MPVQVAGAVVNASCPDASVAAPSWRRSPRRTSVDRGLAPREPGAQRGDAGSTWRGQMMMLSGFSIRVVKADSHRAAIAPSMTRWSADRVTVMRVAA